MKISSLEIERMITVAIHPELAEHEALQKLDALSQIYSDILKSETITEPENKFSLFFEKNSKRLIPWLTSVDELKDFCDKFEICFQFAMFNKIYQAIMSRPTPKEVLATVETLRKLLQENEAILRKNKECLVEINNSLVMAACDVVDYALMSVRMNRVIETISHIKIKSQDNQAISIGVKATKAADTEQINSYIEQILELAKEKGKSKSWAAKRHFKENKDALLKLGIESVRTLENRISKYKTGHDSNAVRKSKTNVKSRSVI